MADLDLIQALMQRKRLAPEDLHAQLRDPVDDPLSVIHAGGYGRPTPDSRAGRTADSEGVWRNPQRPGDDSFEQRVAHGLNDAATLANIPQAGVAIGNAIEDPSLGKVTNAAAQTGMAMFKPGLAAGALLGGYGVAAAKDMGISATSPANAQKKPQGSSPSVADMPGLEAAQNAEYRRLMDRMATGGMSGPERRATEAAAAELRKLSSDYASKKNADQLETERMAKVSQQQDYDNAVARADNAKNAELSRDKRFSGSNLEGVYNATGGAPFLAAALAGGAGAIDRLAKGAPKSLGDYARVGLEGTGAASLGLNGPLLYDVNMAPTANPEKLAYQAYARELPPTHPRKKEFTDYAASLPDENPTQKVASERFYDPWKFAERTGQAILEGVPSAITGANLPGAARKVVSGVGEIPGETATGYRKAMGKALTAKQEQQGAVSRLRDEQQQLAQQQRLAAEAQQLEQEALRSKGGSKVSEGETVPPGEASQGGKVLSDQTQVPRQLPPPEPPGNSSSQTPVLNGGNNAAGGGINQGPLQIEGMDDLTRALRDFKGQATGATGTKPAGGIKGRDGQLDPYNLPNNGASPADAARQVYLDASGAGMPTTGKGGSLTKAAFPKEADAALQSMSGDPAAKGLAIEQLHKRRLMAEKLIGDLAKRDGTSYRDAAAKYFAAEPTVGADGMRRNLPALSVGGAVASGGAMLDPEAVDPSTIDPADRRFALARALLQARQ